MSPPEIRTSRYPSFLTQRYRGMNHPLGDSRWLEATIARTPFSAISSGILATPRLWTCLLLAFCLPFAHRPALSMKQADISPAQALEEQELRRTVSKSLNSLGIHYYKEQQPMKAIETLEEALRYDPESADIRTNLAMIYLQQQQFEKVLDTLGGMKNLDEHDPRALTALAVSHFVLGRYEKAVYYYEKLVPLQPDDNVLVLTLAAAHHLKGESEESARLLRRLPDEPVTRAQYHAILADGLRFRGKLPEALTEYEKARALAPELPRVNYQIGLLQSQLQDYEKVVRSFLQELKINPGSFEASYSLGAYYLNYGSDPGAAKSYFEKTLQLNPQHLDAYLGLMKIYLDDAQAAEALQLAEKAEALGKGSDNYHYLKSRALNLLGKKDLAEKELQIFKEIREKKNQLEGRK